ncbi:hypothetical protein ACTXP3_27750, partial [Klebsiella pneumoniae]|uniref:hypothetical protein n=1 Tax=Klebsiella pneumoniae TaxID=573 RepID=UPI003FD6493E
TTGYYISIKPETDYYKSHQGQVAFYDDEMNLLSYHIQSTQGLITSPAGAYFARLSAIKGDVHVFQFEEGSAGTSYEG